MKLKDLLEDRSPESNIMPYRAGEDAGLVRKINKARSTADHQHVGTGYSAYVGKTNTAHEMDNVQRTAPAQDGGSIYLAYVYKHREQLYNNPYFPRVLQQPGKGKYPTINVERLVPMTHTTMPPLLAKSMLQRYIITKGFPMSNFTDTKGPSGEHFAFIMDDAVHDNDYTRILDPKLVDALKIIRQIADKYSLRIDINPNNVMLRMVGTMPQLVITDPLT